MNVHPLDVDANFLEFLRFLKKIGLVSKKTYLVIGHDLIINGKSKKNRWRQASWNEYLKSS